MYTFKITSQFKKYLKRIKNDKNKLIHLKEVLGLLEQFGVLPEKYKLYKLLGKYEDFMECHIENDLLLIWLDDNNKIIKLIRLGKHSELFK